MIALDRIKLQGVYDRIGNLTVAGYLDRLQETIIEGARIGYGVNVARDMDHIGPIALNRIKLQGVYDRIGNLPVAGYLDRFQETVIVEALIGYGVNVTRDMDHIVLIALSRIKFHGVYDRIGNLPFAGYPFSFQ